MTSENADQKQMRKKAHTPCEKWPKKHYQNGFAWYFTVFSVALCYGISGWLPQQKKTMQLVYVMIITSFDKVSNCTLYCELQFAMMPRSFESVLYESLSVQQFAIIHHKTR